MAWVGGRSVLRVVR